MQQQQHNALGYDWRRYVLRAARCSLVFVATVVLAVQAFFSLPGSLAGLIDANGGNKTQRGAMKKLQREHCKGRSVCKTKLL